MYKIIKAEKLNEIVYLMVVEAPMVAKHCQPGQFIIVKEDDAGERIPLTICDYDREAGTVTIVFQPIGASTEKSKLGETIILIFSPLNSTKFSAETLIKRLHS